MDFYAMKRKQLQSLCKTHGIPANLRNVEMADRLALLLKEDEQPIEPESKKFEENEREIDSDVEMKKVKRVRFSPENQTHYFVGTDNDSDADCEYNPKKKVGTERKSVVAQGASKKKVLENSSEVQPLVEMIDFPGIVTRSRRQTMVKGDAQAIFSPSAANKKKVKTAVKKVDVWDKLQAEDELTGRADGYSQGGKPSGGLVQIHLRSRMVVREEKNQVSKKTKENKASDGNLLPSENDEYNVPARTSVQPEKIQKSKGNVKKVEDSTSVVSDKSSKIHLGGRITQSQTQVEGKNSGVETEEGMLEVRQKCAEALKDEQTFKGPDRNYFRRKSAAPLTRSVHDEEPAADANEHEKTIRRSKRNLARDKVSVCRPLADTKVAGRSKKLKSVFVGKALGGKECLEVPKLEEPSKSTSITTSRQKFHVVQNGKELKTGDTRKRPRNTDSGKAFHLEQNMETVGQSVLLPNAPVRRSKRRTTLLSSAAIDDTELRTCEAAATVKESTESISGKASSVTRTQMRSSRNVPKQIVIEVKKDRFSKEATLEKESSYVVNDSLNRRSERRSSHNVSKLNFDAPTRFAVIAAGKNKESESRTPVTAEEVLCAKLKSPVEKEPNPNELDVLDTSVYDNDIDSCSIRDGVDRPSKKRKKSSKKSKCLNIGDSAGDLNDHSCPSLNIADTNVDPIHVEGLDKLSDMLSTTFTFPGNDQSPIAQPYCEGERSNLLYSGEADESLTSKTEDQKSDVGDDQLAHGSKTSVLADQNLVELDSSCIDPPVLEEALENKESDQTTENGEVVEERSALSCCERKEKFQVDNSCPSLNRGATGHDNTVEQNPVECSDKFSNVVTSKCISFGDGHSECDVADDQWEDVTKASFPLDQSLVQLGARAVDQQFLVESLENKKPDLTTEKSSNTVNGTSDLGRNETVQVDVDSRETAETTPETDGAIHQGETVRSDTVAPSKSPQIKQETVSEECERKMDSTVLKTTEFQEDEMAISEVTPACQSLEENDRPITEVKSVCEESDRNAEMSSEVEEEKTDLCPYEAKEMVQVDVTNAVETVETFGKTLEEIHEGGLALNDTWLTPPKSLILKQDENQFEAQATVVRESNINHIGQIDSCSYQTDICEEATSSWTAELLSGHEKSEVVAPKENQFGNLTETVKIVNDESESTERNSKLDDDYAQAGEDKIHEVIHESIDRASEGIIETHVNEDADEGIGSLFSYELPHIMSNEGEQFKLPDEYRNLRERDEALLHGSKNQKNFDELCFPEEHTVAASMNIYSNHESCGYAVLNETEPGSLFDFDLVKMQGGDVVKSQGPSDMVMPVGSEALQSAQQLDQLNGYPDMHKEDSPEPMNLYPNHESSMKVMVDETDSGSPFVLDLEKLQDQNVDKSQGPSDVVLPVDREVVQPVPQLDQVQYGDPYKHEDVSLEMKTHASFSVDEHMSMDHNVGTLYSGINSNRACSEEIGSGNVNDCLAGDELADPSSCYHAIISSNAVENNMSQTEANLAGTDGIVDADSIGKVERSADNACDKPQAGSDLNGSNDCNESGKRNREEEEKTNNDEDSDILDVTAPFQEVEVALESKAHACSVEGVYLDAMNGFNVDKSATSRENFEGLSDVQKDNQDLSVESEIFTHWEMSTIFGDAKKDLYAESVEPFRCYLNNMRSENAMDVAENTKIVQECNRWFSGKQLRDPEHNAELVEEPPTLEDNKRWNEQKYINYENDKCRNSGVAEGSAYAMNSDRMEIQHQETRDSSLQFSSELPRMAYSEPYESNLLADGTSIKVANQISMEVTETRLGKFDEVCFKGGGMLTVASSERGKCASAAASDSVSGNGQTTETVASMRKMNEESSSIGISFEAQGKHYLDVIPAVVPNNIIPQLAATECPDRNNSSFDDAVLVFGHSNNNIASDEFNTRSMEEIDDNRKYDDGTELVEETQLRLVGGNLSDERKFPDANSVSGISSSWADGPSDLTVAKHNVSCTYPERRGLPMHEDDKFSMVERVSDMKIDEDRNAERSIDYSANSPVTASSHEMKDLKLNAASSVLNSFEMRLLFKLFSDDNIDGHETSNRDESKVNSTNAKSDDMKKGKESAVVTAQFAAGQLTDHDYEMEGVDCVDQKITQEMGIHCHGDLAITNFSAHGDKKRGDVQNLDAGMISEDVKERIEDAPGTAQTVIEQLDDHGQRRRAELPESPPPVSDEYRPVNEVSKQEGIRPISHEFFACEDIHESGDLQNSYLGIRTGELRADLELSDRTSDFDVTAATKDHTCSESDRNNLIPDVEGTKFPVENDIESEVDVTAVQCVTSAHSASRKENPKLPTKRSWEEDSDKKIIASSARLESKKYGLIPKTPKTVANTFDMKENFISTKSNRFSNSAAKSSQTRKALEDLQK